MEIDILKKRHSLSHILAQALQREMDVNIKLGVGPAIDNGFYYDVLLDNGINEQDLGKIEEQMRKIVKEKQLFFRFNVDIETAKQIVNLIGQEYKLELIEEFKANGEKIISFYVNSINKTAKDVLLKGLNSNYISKYEQLSDKLVEYGFSGSEFATFIDMCEGPHVENTKEIDTNTFKLAKIAGAYWRGNENNIMMSRIYGYAFESKDELKNYLNILEESKKRDHRKLGKELGLFVFSELVGSGLPMYTHKGNIIRKEIIKFSNELQSEIGYEEVHTPNINRGELFKISGHYEKYKEDMFKVISNYTEEEYYLKPMNCPQHTQIYASRQRSYNDLPIRIADFSNLYRDERPGELNGLSRLRCFCQDDGHSFCREDQIKQEFSSVLKLIKEAMRVYGMSYNIRLSLWDPNNKNKYLGDEFVWEKSQKLLEEILIENNIEYFKKEGEAAIYGPKMDLISKDSLGREWQLSTIQLDFIMPQRFDLKYNDKDGQSKTPVMIHRALVGSPERFMSILIEHFAGLFPLWLAPEQIRIIPVADKFNDFALEILSKMKSVNLRAKIDDSEDSFSKKIRKAEIEKVSLIIIIGEKEITNNILSVRDVKTKEQYEMGVDQFIANCLEKIKNRSL